MAVAMKQPFENGLPEGQANPFVSPTSMAVAEPDHATEMTQPLAQYSRVRRGLQLIYYSIATLAGMFVLMLLVILVLKATKEPGAPRDPVAANAFSGITTLCGIVSLVAMVVMVVGFCMTSACPRLGERLRAIISVVCFFLSFSIWIAGNIFLMDRLSPPDSAAVSLFLALIAFILSCASMVLFCLLLERIGRNISNSRLEKIARALLAWYGILLIVVLVGGGMMSLDVFNNVRTNGTILLSDNAQFLLGSVWGLTTFVIALTVLFKYLAMLRIGIEELAVKPLARHA